MSLYVMNCRLPGRRKCFRPIIKMILRVKLLIVEILKILLQRKKSLQMRIK
uniref:Predicted protein n=1 Tax=Hordeum vulgare subsp. vulgare TaxID=112509 RepID=F2DYH5_HORVV|nr:predicted protein [Hordeum vulgare subsp. vulgare]